MWNEFQVKLYVTWLIWTKLQIVTKRVTGVCWRGSYVILPPVEARLLLFDNLNIRLYPEACGYPRREQPFRSRGCPRYPERVTMPSRTSFVLLRAYRFLLVRMPVHRNIDRHTASKYHRSFTPCIDPPSFVSTHRLSSNDDRESSPYNGFIVARMLKQRSRDMYNTRHGVAFCSKQSREEYLIDNFSEWVKTIVKFPQV